MITIYRLIAKHPKSWGANETPHRSMQALTREMKILEKKGYNHFIIDIYEVTE